MAKVAKPAKAKKKGASGKSAGKAKSKAKPGAKKAKAAAPAAANIPPLDLPRRNLHPKLAAGPQAKKLFAGPLSQPWPDPKPSIPNWIPPEHRRTFPLSTMGKLEITYKKTWSSGAKAGQKITAGGSGVLVAPYLVLTAAHCLNNPDHGPADNAVFIPAHSDDVPSNALGRWSASSANLKWHDGWPQPQGGERFDWRYDVALIYLSPTGGLSPEDACGGYLTPAFFPDDFNQVRGFGYPGAKGSQPDGGDLYECAGAIQPMQNYDDSWVAMASRLTRGASGGPWLRDFSFARVAGGTTTQPPKGSNVVVGINSFKNTNDETLMYSPYFGQGVMDWLMPRIEAAR